MSIEATEHHEIVLEVESELRGLRKAFDLVQIHIESSAGIKEGGTMEIYFRAALSSINEEIEFAQGVLDEITEDDEDE